jgi:hypothetical protein
MKARGHVFVVRGDVKSIACDWQVVPSGTDPAGRPGEIRRDWLAGEFGELWRSSGLSGMAPNEEQRAVALARDPTRRGFIVVHIGHTGNEDPDWFARPIGEVGRLVTEAGLPALRGRERVLVALPMLGTRGGGKSNRRGAVMRELLAAADAAAETWDVDYVFVLRDAQGYSAAQRLRADRGLDRWEAHLDARTVKTAERLAKAAREGTLVAFIGAGLSAASGLPTWRDLLTALAQEADLAHSEIKALRSLDARDAGAILERRYRDKGGLDQAIRRRFEGPEVPSLAHYLLASIPITEAATTNYDSLFERAWKTATGDQPAVLPGGTPRSSRRWLLKLHGDVGNKKRPLVLSREQYLRFEQTSGAIAAVVQAMLLTRHLLIIGYGLTDETFHRLAYEVREVRQDPERKAVASSSQGAGSQAQLGTALLVDPVGLVHEVWQDEIDLIALRSKREHLAAGARRQEILLDLIGHLAAPAEAYLLGKGWQELSKEEPDKALFDVLKNLATVIAARQLPVPLQEAARDTLKQFGWAD